MTNMQFKDLTNYGEISWDDLAYVIVPVQFNSDHAGTWVNYRVSVQDLLADCGRTYVNAADPTTLDDVDSGYKIGDEWVNSTSSAVFKCLDASVGAAVWNEMPTSGLPATTAANDFVVGNGSSWLKKTLAEVKTILGLAALAYKATVGTADIDNDAVTLAKLVNASAQYKLLGRASASAGDWEEISSSANVFTFLGAADYSAMRTQLGLVIGTNVQAQDAELAAIAGLASAADSFPYFTGSGTASMLAIVAAIRTILASADVATFRTNAGLGTGNSPQFTGIELGHASDTTLTRSAAGQMAVEGVAVPTISSTNTLTNKRVTPRDSSNSNPGSPVSWNSDNYDQITIYGLTGAITINADSGTPTNGQKILFRIKDNGVGARGLTWTTGASKAFRAIGVTLPTTTVLGKTHYIGAIYNSTDDRWDVLAVGAEA